MKKNILLLGLLILLSGCTTKYNLTFSGDKIKENIDINIDNAEIKLGESYVPGIESDNRINNILKEDQYPLFNNEKVKYDKKVTRKGSYTNVKLSHSYTFDEYLSSNAYLTCFENKKMTKNRNSYSLSLNGNFYCLYSDDIEINIKTDREVLKHNADKVKGNTYTWIINSENVKDANIYFQMSTRYKTINTILIVVALVVGVVLLGGGFIIYSKLKNRDSINEI